MDTLNLLLDGFQSALTPENLLYACIGVLLGTFVGVLPGIGPAMAVALLLPITYGLDVTQSLIMFAGIYYGGMYGGSTTSILLNTPGESASVMTAIEGNKMAKRGRAAQALATAAIGSFIAGTIGTLLVAFFMPRDRRAGGEDRRAVVLRDHAALPGAGHQRPGLLEDPRLHRPLHRPDDRAGRAGPVHRAGAAHRRRARARGRHRHRGRRGRRLRRRRGAVDRGAPAAQAGRRDPGRAPVHGARGLAALLGTVVPGHGARLPVRRGAGRRRGDADVPVLRHRAQARRPQGERTSSARAPSRVSPGPRRPTTRAPRACSCRCWRSGSRSPRPPRS